MRSAHFILLGMLLFSLFSVILITPAASDEPNGTRSPGADVTLSTLTTNQTVRPTDSIGYIFVVNNTGDEMDNFSVSCISVHDWLVNWSNHIVGPLESNESVNVVVNVTVPMGTPPNTRDNITFTAQSRNDLGLIEDIMVNTTVIETFIVSIDIEGKYEKTLSIDPPFVTNYTLTIKNKGNEEITITLQHSTPVIGWGVTFPQFPNKKVTISKANSTHEGIEHVNVSISAPLDASPGFEMTLNLWGERTDAFPIWYSFQDQENITINTVVQSKISLNLSPEMKIGYAGVNDTIFNFTMQNLGNTDVIIDLIPITDGIIGVTIDISRVNLREGELPIVNRIWVSTAANAPLGNYTINVSAINNLTGEFIDKMELYYIIAPVLNITDISISDSDPLQYEKTTIFASIENIGFINARNITVKFFDGSKKIGETYLEYINASEMKVANISWTPSDFGNRSILVSIDVEGEGNFSEHGTAIAELKKSFDVEINWQPYYMVIFIIIIVVLGFGVAAGLNELRYYGGVPHLNHAGGVEDEEEGDYGEYPEDELPPLDEEGEFAEREEKPFGTFGIKTEPEPPEPEPFAPRYEPKEKLKYTPPPEPTREPPKEEPVMAMDPETMRMERELKEQFAQIQDELNRTKSQGVDTNNIDGLINTAKKNLSEGEHAKAKQYLGYASERLKNLNTKRNEALQAIKEAREVLSGMGGSEDLTIVENFLVKADSLLKEGDFREAINYAKKAKDRAQRLQRREMRL